MCGNTCAAWNESAEPLRPFAGLLWIISVSLSSLDTWHGHLVRHLRRPSPILWIAEVPVTDSRSNTALRTMVYSIPGPMPIARQ